ncbi:MAG: hypothetical protein Q8Q31_00920 [Nanoarchaeota archaeon]|nr:hypothetical protein [Nanoarchaeota archaeon]
MVYEKGLGILGPSGDVITQLGQIGLWLQAIGLVIIIWIVMQVVSYLMNRKRMREVYNIKKDMKRIEAKIDRILLSKRK